MTSVFQGVTEVDSLKTWDVLYLQMNVQCTCQCLELAKMTASGPKTSQKWNPFKSPSLLLKSWLGAQWQLWLCPSYMCCLQTKLWEQSITKRAFSHFFYLMIWIRTVITRKVAERRFIKTCWIWHCCRTEHQLTRPQKLKISSETIFLNSNQRLMTPKHAWPVSHRKSLWNFQSQGGNVKTLLHESWISSDHCRNLPGNC